MFRIIVPRHPGKYAYNNGRKTVKTLFHLAEKILTEDYGYDFSDKEVFPNGFIDMIGHADAYADWLSSMKDMFREEDYELLAAIRYIVDFSDHEVGRMR